MHQGPLGVRGAGAWIGWMTAPRRRPTEVLLDITTEGGVSFHVGTKPRPRRESQEGRREARSPGDPGLRRRSAQGLLPTLGGGLPAGSSLDAVGIVKLRRRQIVQARCLQNKGAVTQKESLCQNHRWEWEAGKSREKRPVRPLFWCMGHLLMHRDSVA